MQIIQIQQVSAGCIIGRRCAVLGPGKGTVPAGCSESSGCHRLRQTVPCPNGAYLCGAASNSYSHQILHAHFCIIDCGCIQRLRPDCH